MTGTATSDPEFTVSDDPGSGRFVMHRDGEIVGFAVYQEKDGVVIIPHVETLAPHRGQGYGARLMDGLVDIVRSDGRRIRPLCSFAAGHLSGDNRFRDLLA